MILGPPSSSASNGSCSIGPGARGCALGGSDEDDGCLARFIALLSWATIGSPKGTFLARAVPLGEPAIGPPPPPSIETNPPTGAVPADDLRCLTGAAMGIGAALGAGSGTAADQSVMRPTVEGVSCFALRGRRAAVGGV